MHLSFDSVLYKELKLCEKSNVVPIIPNAFSLSLAFASQQFNEAEHFVQGSMMQRNVSKETNIGEGMTKSAAEMKRKRIKDRPKGSQTGRQEKRNSCMYLIVT